MNFECNLLATKRHYTGLLNPFKFIINTNMALNDIE